MKVFVIEVVLVSFIIYSMFESLMCSLMNRLQYRTFIATLGSCSATERLFLVSKEKPKGESKWQFQSSE